MKTLTKLAATAAFVPVVAVSGSAFAGSPGQLAGGDTYQVKNLTQKGAYANSISAACNDEIQYSMMLSNTQFGALNNVTLKASLPSNGGTSTAVATTDLGGNSGNTDTASVSLPAGATQTLENGTTVLYGDHGNALQTLPDTITSGVNIGTLNGSTTEFVNFKAKVNCPTPAAPVYSCDAFGIVAGDNRTVSVSNFKTTATNGATFSNATINWGDNSNALTTASVVGQNHTYAQDGTYTIVATANFDVNGQSKSATSAACEQQVTFKANQPPIVTPPSTPATPAAPTQLVNTGAGNVVGLFAAATAAGAAAYRFVVSRRLSRQ